MINCIFLLNTACSACYASKGMWKESMAEAEIAVNKDSKYMKAYYRLAVAQAELGQFDDSIQTLHNGLSKEPGKLKLYVSGYIVMFMCLLVDDFFCSI